MTGVVVTGLSLISALGSLESTWAKLLLGQSGLRVGQPFPELEPRPLGLIAPTPSLLNDLIVVLVEDSLRDAELFLPLVDCGVVFGSSRSYQGQWEAWAKQLHAGKEGFHPQQSWLDVLPQSVAIAVARHLNTTGPVLSPMAACATGLWAIAQGFELVRTGQCDRVLVGAVEAPITPLTLAGFQSMGALAATGAYPFDRQRQGLVLGEGGAILVLESAALAQQRGAKIYGQVLGFGLTADGYHVSAPNPDSRGAIVAVKQCLDRSHLTPQQIDYIHAHGTATQLNDRNEAFLIDYLFGQNTPVSSTKGATGHTLGASGALGAVFCLLALQHQILPPCVGLQSPEFELDLVTTARSVTLNHTLCFSFGFGGQNAAIAFKSYRFEDQYL